MNTQSGGSHYFLFPILAAVLVIGIGTVVMAVNKRAAHLQNFSSSVANATDGIGIVDDADDGSIVDEQIVAMASSDAAKAVYKSPPELTGEQIEGKMFHMQEQLGQTYAFENSPRGIRYAARHKYTSIDLDLHVSKDGIPVVTHWDRPLLKDGFYDPEGKIAHRATVGSLTYAELRRLRNKDHKSQIYSLKYMCGLLAKYKLNLSLEVKVPSTTYNNMGKITNIINEAQVTAYVKGNVRHTGMPEMLAQSRKIGYWTRGTLHTEGWLPPDAPPATN